MSMVPPRELYYQVGSRPFLEIGFQFLGTLIALSHLKPGDRVLDIGCGPGRAAAPLTQYLTSGSYEGIDVVPPFIEWCQQRITSRYPGFRFTLANLRNGYYNPTGQGSPAVYSFPFQAGEFSFAIAVSLFTHLPQDALKHYMAETARVLSAGGTFLVTFFLLNDESRESIAAGTSQHAFLPVDGICMAVNPERLEEAIAYDEKFVREALASSGFSVRATHYGRWAGRAESDCGQDTIIAIRD